MPSIAVMLRNTKLTAEPEKVVLVLSEQATSSSKGSENPKVDQVIYLFKPVYCTVSAFGALVGIN